MKTPEEKVRHILYNLLMDTNPISDDEKQFLYDSVRLPEIRTLIAEFLKGIS